LREERRAFHRALSQATEHLVLSYPRADPRSGRERLPSAFFMAAASALAGRPLGALDLARLVQEDDLDLLPLEDALDRSERDRARMRHNTDEASGAIAAGCAIFKQARLASQARWRNELTAYDGLVAWPPGGEEETALADAVRQALDPTAAGWPVSASRLATYAQCGFRYMLQYVLRLEPALEPEERTLLDPLERGTLFHEVAERFLRELRDTQQLPVTDTPEMQARALALADEGLDGLVAACPPRYTFLWERERTRFREGVLSWLRREAANVGRSSPAYFEVAFGLGARTSTTPEPHDPQPLDVELGDGRRLRLSGKIDRIDRRPDGRLVLRDYKTGRAPWKDDGGQFKGGRQLQIPFYILAVAKLLPDKTVAEAILDYVYCGRQVGFDLESVTGERFRALLRGMLDAIAQGRFVQEPSSCTWCDYTAVCGPRPLLELRRHYKINDPRLQQVLRLRDFS
jgi:RecB family exonuclease